MLTMQGLSRMEPSRPWSTCVVPSLLFGLWAGRGFSQSLVLSTRTSSRTRSRMITSKKKRRSKAREDNQAKDEIQQAGAVNVGESSFKRHSSPSFPPNVKNSVTYFRVWRMLTNVEVMRWLRVMSRSYTNSPNLGPEEVEW